MAVLRGSRYANAYVGIVNNTGGKAQPVLFRGPKKVSRTTTRTYQVVAGDRLDKLSFSFYGTETLWWVIADANIFLQADPLTPGMVLRIPNGAPDL